MVAPVKDLTRLRKGGTRELLIRMEDGSEGKAGDRAEHAKHKHKHSARHNAPHKHT